MIRAAAVLVLVTVAGTQPGSAADPAAGKAAFNKCRICHTLEPGGRSAAGPNLHGLFGRKAGAVDNFAYSPAMKQSGVVWDEQTLTKYLHRPKDFVPGTRMAFPGIASDKEIADLLAFLHQATQ